MAPPEQRRALVLVDAHTTTREQVIKALVSKITRLFNASPSRDFYTAEGQRRLAGQIAELDRLAQMNYANQTIAYLDAMARQVGEKAPSKVEPLPKQPRGTDPVEVWLRPFEQFRYEYSKSKDEARARIALTDRAELIAGDDVKLGMRIVASNHAEATKRVIGQRRVVHPELSKGGSCGLCLVASDQIYRTGDLLPLHNGCNCGVAEVFEDSDPGSSLNDMSLQQLYDAAGDTGRQELQRVRYRVVEHDELGPVLTAA